MSKSIEVVLFDLGGVLIELTGMQTLLGWFGSSTTPEQVWEKWLASPVVREFETGKIDHDVFATRLVDEMSLSVGPDEFLNEFIYWPSGLLPGARELVEGISPEYKLATLSNSNHLHWPRVMEEMGVVELFDHFFASHIIGKIKPDIEVFEHVIDELGSEPSAILFIDDNRVNVEAARIAGMQAVEAKGTGAAQRVLEKYRVLNLKK